MTQTQEYAYELRGVPGAWAWWRLPRYKQTPQQAQKLKTSMVGSLHCDSLAKNRSLFSMQIEITQSAASLTDPAG